ncbi:MAG TPA: MFS transporter [Gemmataceae bacterium]|nr:MFS transporter [Gemmataceae bacterium]
MGERIADLAPERDVATPSRVRYLVLAVAGSLAVLTYFQRQGFIAGTPEIQRALDIDDEQMGYLLAAWLVAYGIFQVPGGLLADRLGARRLLTGLVLGWSLTLGAVALLALLPARGWAPLASLIFLRFLFGTFQAGGFPGLARVVADWVPRRQRGFAQGLIWTCSRAGGFAAPLVVGLWLFPAFFGWPIPFLLLGAVGLLWCAAFWPWFRDRPAEMRGVNAAERALLESERPATAARPAPLPWSRFLASRNVVALCLMYGFVGFSGNFITNWLPSYLKHHRHLDDRLTAWLSGMPLAFGIVSCLAGGAVSDWLVRRLGNRKWGRRLVGCAALVLGSASALAPIWVDRVWLLGLAFSAWFFFNDLTMAPAWAAAADVGERHTGALSGAMNMTGSFFAAVGMWLAGWLFRRHLDDAVFVLFALAYALAALCWLGIDVTRPLVPRGDET